MNFPCGLFTAEAELAPRPFLMGEDCPDPPAAHPVTRSPTSYGQDTDLAFLFVN